MSTSQNVGPNDVLAIEDLEVFTFLGTHEYEQRERQKVLVSVELEVPAINPGADQRDEAALNWSALCQTVIRTAEARPRRLLETLTLDIAEEILKFFQVFSVCVEVKRLSRTDAKWLSVRIKRGM